jgi:hypothetical protein
MIGDGADDRSFADKNSMLAAGEEFTVEMRPRGGFVATLKRQD